MPTPAENPRPMDWLARLMAWGTMMVPKVAPSKWQQDERRRRANDLHSVPFTVKADDGVNLDACYFPPREIHLPVAPDVAAPANPRPTVFFSHGWTETKEFHFRLVRVLIGQGFPVVIFDQRGHGRSGGTCTLGILEPSDLRAVIDEAVRRGYADGRVLSMGVSMGGTSVLREAVSDARVAAVVAYAPFISFVDAIRSYGRRYVPFLSAEWGVRGFVQQCARYGLNIEDASGIEAIKRLTVPVLLVVGECDVNLPACDHARLLHAAVNAPHCGLIEVPDATHFNICMDEWPGLDEKVLGFLRAAVSDPLSLGERTDSNRREAAI